VLLEVLDRGRATTALACCLHAGCCAKYNSFEPRGITMPIEGLILISDRFIAYIVH
jgi:hypothetical protein